MRLPLNTLLVVAASTLASLSQDLASFLDLQRAAVLDGQLWRLFSAHLVHFTPAHLVTDLLVFAAAGWFIERKGPGYFWSLYMVTALMISTCLLLTCPSMSNFGGLSGVASGALFYCALSGFREPGYWRLISGFIIAALPLKALTDLYMPRVISDEAVQQAFVPMPLSHVVGIFAALIFFLIVRRLTPKKPDSTVLVSRC